MVFQKLTDTDKEQLAIFGQEHDKKQVSAMRALIMRGASPNEARAMAIERDDARNKMAEALEKEKEQRDAEFEANKPRVRAKRAPRKAKVVETIEEEDEEGGDEAPPPPSPKLKRTRSKSSKENENPNQITILA